MQVIQWWLTVWDTETVKPQGFIVKIIDSLVLTCRLVACDKPKNAKHNACKHRSSASELFSLQNRKTLLQFDVGSKHWDPLLTVGVSSAHRIHRSGVIHRINHSCSRDRLKTIERSWGTPDHKAGILISLGLFIGISHRWPVKKSRTIYFLRSQSPAQFTFGCWK